MRISCQLIMKQSTSLENIHRHAQKTKEITKNIVIKASDFSTYFSLFLANSRGKDKLLSLLQYTFDFMQVCGRNSNIPQLRQAYFEKELLDMLIYYNLKENISSARKVFRLFRFFDEIKGLAKIIKTNRPLAFKLLSVFTYFCSCSYYLCDNSLWFVGILNKSGVVEKSLKKRLKRQKNSFSFCRVVAYLIILFYSVFLDRMELKWKERELHKRRKNSDHGYFKVEENLGEGQAQIGKELIEIRRRIRFYYMEITISMLRLIMLTSSLKLKYHNNLDPIFVGLCGLISSTLNFIKTIFQKKVMMKLEKPSPKPLSPGPSFTEIHKEKSFMRMG